MTVHKVRVIFLAQLFCCPGTFCAYYTVALRPPGRPGSNHNMGGEKGFSGTFVLARLTVIESALCQKYAKYFHIESTFRQNA